MEFRCAAASAERQDLLVGTASTVRAFLLVENAGPWGENALHDSRFPSDVMEQLRFRAQRARVRPLLIRRHRRAVRGPGPERMRVFAAYADPHHPRLESTELTSAADLLGLDIDALGRGGSSGMTPCDDPLFLVCTHGRHDACCAERGRPVAAALSRSHPEQTWEVSHIGGDRFAANLLILPDGLYYGRLDASSSATVADGHLAGRLDLDLLRGRSGYGFPVQVAEVALRRLLDETRVDAVTLLAAQIRNDDTEVVMSVAGQRFRVQVASSRGAEPQQLTCGAARLSPIPEFRVASIERV